MLHRPARWRYRALMRDAVQGAGPRQPIVTGGTILEAATGR
jgi:hypothetical protein